MYGFGGSQLNPDEFDAQLKVGFDNELYRAQDQAWGEQLAFGLGKGISKIFLKSYLNT